MLRTAAASADQQGSAHPASEHAGGDTWATAWQSAPELRRQSCARWPSEGLRRWSQRRQAAQARRPNKSPEGQAAANA
eukprot:4638165-Alexandrium_andersonii.AAC.1